VRTVVLERGRRWTVTAAGDTFPPFFSPDHRSSWTGSTIRARPGGWALRRSRTTCAHPNYVGTWLFLDQARRAGLHAELAPNALDWDVVRAELAGRAVPSVSVGEYLFGVNSGARNSVDKNYLARAERSGHVEVRPLHRVAGLTTDRAGRYRVATERMTSTARCWSGPPWSPTRCSARPAPPAPPGRRWRRGRPVGCPGSTSTSAGTGATTATGSTCAPWCPSGPGRTRAGRSTSRCATRATPPAR
jgi:hypothetical protein